MISATRYFGDARFVDLGGTSDYIYPFRWRVYTISTSAGTTAAKLPPLSESTVLPGGPYAYIINIGGFAAKIQNYVGTDLATINAGQYAIVYVRSNAPGTKNWQIRTGSLQVTDE